MSLQIWLPLNGDLKNQGLDDITVTNNGATIDDNGKIGKCYSFDGSDDYIDLGDIGHYFNGSPFSITFWIYSKESGTRGIVFSSFNLPSISNFFSIEINGSSGTLDNYFRFDWLGKDVGVFHNAFTPNMWLHFAVTYDGEKIICYRDGEIFEEKVVILSPIPVGNKFYLGRDNRTGYTALKGKLNDFRLYDHALSLKEIKEISKGLIVHYPLNRNGCGRENLLPCGGTYTKDSPWTTNLNRTDGYVWVTGSAFEGIPNKTYTISVECDGTLSNVHGKGKIPLSDKPFAFWLYVCNIDTTKAWKKGSYDAPYVLTSANHNYRKIGNTHVWTITLSDTQKYMSLRTNSYSDGTEYITINWWNMKIEEGDTFTGWSPNLSSSLGKSMQFNESIEYDVSGYGNDGIKIGDFEYDTDTPRYNLCTNSKNGVSTYLKGIILPKEAKTVSLWIKSPKNKSSAIFNDKTSGLQIGLLNSLLYVNSLAATTPFSTTHWKDNGWNHVVVVKDSNTLSCYVNGKAELQSGVKNYYIHEANEFWLWNRSYNNNYPFNGSLSDLRIYVTALSEEDIQNLYKAVVSVDTNNNYHSYSYNELTQNREIEYLYNLKLYGNNFHSFTQDKDGLNMDGHTWITHDYIPINPTGKTYKYDITYSCSTGNQFYIGWERYDVDKTPRNNNACIYIIDTTPTTDIVKKRVNGIIDLSTDGVNPCAFIRLRILNNWTNSSGNTKGTATIHSLSLKEYSNNDVLTPLNHTKQGIVNATEIIEENAGVSINDTYELNANDYYEI